MVGLPSIVDTHATSNPNVLAAIDDTGAWTYAQLRDASFRVATLLLNRSLCGEQSPHWDSCPLAPRPLLFALPRDRIWYALCVGAWRVSLPIVALSTDLPDKAAERERGLRALRELRPIAAVIAGTVGEEGLPTDCVPLERGEFVAAIEAPNLWSGVVQDLGGTGPSPDSVLVYCYTGGTTKHSKCLAVTHAMALWEMEHYSVALPGAQIARSDRVLQYTSAYWGASAFGQIDIALAFGACVVLVPSEPGLDWIASAIEKYTVNVLGTVPSQLRGVFPGGPSTRPLNLHTVITWGERFPTKLSHQWKEHCATFELLIASEYWLSLFTDCSKCMDAVDGQEKHILKPLPQLDMVLVNEEGQITEEVGEMWLSGPTVSPGYVDADGRVGTGPDNQAAYTQLNGKRYLRTRDRLRRAPGGGFLYCGRLGTLAKRGGAWVDMEALEISVSSLPGIASAVLLAGDEVDAFLIVDEAPQMPLCQLLSQVRHTLGGLCRLHVRNELPLHPATAKIDRRALTKQLEDARIREAVHRARVAYQQRRLLLSYCVWYLPALAFVIVPALLVDLASAYLSSIVARMLLVPYLWALVLHANAGSRSWRWSLGPSDVVLLVAATMPAVWLGGTAALSCAGLMRVRRAGCLPIITLLMLAVALLNTSLLSDTWLEAAVGWHPLAGALSSMGVVLVLGTQEDFLFLAGLPVCCFLVLPKWLSDEWVWRLRDPGAWLRRACVRFLVRVQQPAWDASLTWDEEHPPMVDWGDERRSNVRLKERYGGMVVNIDFWKRPRPVVNVKPESPNGSCDQVDLALGCSVSQSLAALVERAGGNATALGALDSLQAITLIELIRKEMGMSLPLASLLRCPNLAALVTLVKAAAADSGDAYKHVSVARGGHMTKSATSAAWRVFHLEFPRHPVDWCVRYTGSGHLDVCALQRAADRLVARHSALRTIQSPDEPLREAMDKAAAIWQLWTSCVGRKSRAWDVVSHAVGAALFACWPRTLLKPPKEARVCMRVPLGPRVRDDRWEDMDDDKYVFFTIRELTSETKWPFDISVVPLYHGEPAHMEGSDSVSIACSLPPESVTWYIYCSITHAYSDGASGPALFSDLLRYYAEEAGSAAQPRSVEAAAPEHLALLQYRLQQSLRGRLQGALDANNDVYHEAIDEDWGKRCGMTRRFEFSSRVMNALRVAAFDVLGCGIDVAWLTAIMGSMFRLFPDQACIHLVLKVSCRDGPGEAQMVGFLSEQRVLPVDMGDVQNSTLLNVTNIIDSARRSRAWRAPEPLEPALCVYVNIVSAMVDGLPEGFRHVTKSASIPTNWAGSAYCHLNLRLDQLTADEWDFRLFHWDSNWGWDWSRHFAHAMGAVICDMVSCPTEPLIPKPWDEAELPRYSVKRVVANGEGEKREDSVDVVDRETMTTEHPVKRLRCRTDTELGAKMDLVSGH